MQTAIASLVVATIVLVGVLTLFQSYASSQDIILASRRQMRERLGERARTHISAIGAEATRANRVKMTLRNEGQAKLADFHQWDVIVEYYRPGGVYVVKWLAYVETTPPGSDQWTVAGIYGDASRASPEVYEPGILNPDEEMVIEMRISSPVGPGTTNRVTAVTPNGLSATAVFIR